MTSNTEKDFELEYFLNFYGKEPVLIVWCCFAEVFFFGLGLFVGYVMDDVKFIKLDCNYKILTFF